MLSVLRYKASDYRFGIFLLFSMDLSVFRGKASDYPFGIFLLLAIVLSVLLRCKASDYPFGVLDVRFLTIPLVSFGHCVVCSSSM